MKTVVFENQILNIVQGKYCTTDYNAFSLFNQDEEPFMVASVNLPDEKLENDEIAIKNYSENKGILEALIEAKIVSEPLRFVQSGFVSIPICKLLKD
jgi:hypothetical protein